MSDEAENPLDLVFKIRQATDTLTRETAAYRALMCSLDTAKESPEKRSLPIIRWTARDENNEITEIVTDLNDVDPQYIGHVLTPLVNMHGTRMMNASQTLEKLSAQLSQAFTQEDAEPTEGTADAKAAK